MQQDHGRAGPIRCVPDPSTVALDVALIICGRQRRGAVRFKPTEIVTPIKPGFPSCCGVRVPQREQPTKERLTSQIERRTNSYQEPPLQLCMRKTCPKLRNERSTKARFKSSGQAELRRELEQIVSSSATPPLIFGQAGHVPILPNKCSNVKEVGSIVRANAKSQEAEDSPRPNGLHQLRGRSSGRARPKNRLRRAQTRIGIQ